MTVGPTNTPSGGAADGLGTAATQRLTVGPGVGTVIAERPAHRVAGTDRLRSGLTAIWLEFPDRLLLLALALVIAISLCMQENEFRPIVLIPLFVVLAGALWFLAPRRPDPSRAAVLGTLAAVVITVGWVVVQRHYVGQPVVISRDPAIYTIRAFWLTNHTSPTFTFDQATRNAVAAVPGSRLASGVVGSAGHWQPQSTTVVPGLMAMGYWIGGPSLLFQTPVIIGGGVLLGTYCVGRRLIGPVGGLLPVLVLAVAMPLAAFARQAYTEPISLMMTLLAMLGVSTAWQQRRMRLWVLAGLAAGAAEIARIDGALVPLGLLVGMGGVGAAMVHWGNRRRMLLAIVLFGASAAVTTAIGYRDLRVDSSAYFGSLEHQANLLIYGCSAVFVVALVVTALPWLRQLSAWLSRHRRRVMVVVAAVALIGVIAMLLRPLFYEPHRLTGAYAGLVGGLQKQQGLPSDPTRSYDEQSINWLALYFGWPTVLAAGLAGVAVIATAISFRDVGLTIVAGLTGVTSVLYLNDVQITPDLIWAVRRLLPVIIPGMLLILGWALTSVLRTVRRPGLWSGRRWMRVATVAVAALLAVTAVVFPVLSWNGLFRVKENAGRFNTIQSVCQAAQPAQKLLLVGPTFAPFQPEFQAICGDDVIWLSTATQVQIAAVVTHWGSGQVAVVAHDATVVPSWTDTPQRPTISVGFVIWQRVLNSLQDGTTPGSDIFYIGLAAADGSVTPVADAQ